MALDELNSQRPQDRQMAKEITGSIGDGRLDLYGFEKLERSR